MTSESKTFDIDDLSYKITHNTIKITFQIIKKGNINAESSFNIMKILDISDYFRLFTSIQEIWKELITLIESNKLTTKENNNSYDINFAINFKTIDIIRFPISKISPLNNQSSNINIIELDERLTQLENKMNYLTLNINSRFDSLENKISNRINEMDQRLSLALDTLELQSDNKEIEGSSRSINKNNDKDNNIKGQTQSPKNISCRIIYSPIGFLNEEEMEMMIKWLGNDPSLSFKLLFNPIPGKDTEYEAKRCFYNTSPILVLIESYNGCKFGGYTSIGFTTDSTIEKWRSDPKAFLFSIDRKKQYHIKNNSIDQAIYCDCNYISAWYSGLALFTDFMKQNKNYHELTNYGEGEPIYEMNNGEEYFQVKQLYVYQVRNV